MGTTESSDDFLLFKLHIAFAKERVGLIKQIQ